MNYCIYHCLRLLYVSRQWLLRQLTPTGLGVGLCLVIAALAGGLASGSMLHLLFFLALSLLVLAGLASRLIHYQFRARRILPRFGTVGEPLRYHVVIEKVTPHIQRGLKFVEIRSERFLSFQTFLQITNRYPGFENWWTPWWNHVARQRLAITHTQDLPTLLPGVKTKFKAELLPLRRGQLPLKTLSLACPDPLGLVYRHQTQTIPQSVCILPQRYQLPPLNLANRKPVQMGGSNLVAAMGEALEFRSLRDYRAGDPTNKIHWKSWAKVGHPIVKEEQEESVLHYGLILDSFQRNRVPWDASSEIFEAALSIAVSFVTQPHPEESRLDVIFAASANQPSVPRPPVTQSATCVTVGRGLRQRAQILETLATLNPCQDQDLDSLIPILQTRLPYLSGCFCILLGLDEARVAFLKTLAQHGLPTKVIVLFAQKGDPAARLEYAPPPWCQVSFISLKHIQQELLAL
jgi:uncharacterized protein (DUF58 family)